MSHRLCRSRAAGLAAGLFVGAAILAAAFPVHAQQSASPKWIALDSYSGSAMASSEAARVHAEHSAIAEQAAFFGYDLSLRGWEQTEVVCPEMPGYLILHYQRTDHNGLRSLFTALVPRDSGRVQVVPVLYRNATPFKAAVGSERSLSVFNRAVSTAMAEKDLQSGGSWLQLALCYAAVVGAEPRVPEKTNRDPGLVRAPDPTLLISEVNQTASVSFTDRDAAHRYTVWNVRFGGRGQVVSATATSFADYAAQALSGQAPTEKPLPAETEPKVIKLPPPPPPKTQTIPQ